MKKANTTNANGVDQYFANVPEPAHSTLQKVRATITVRGAAGGYRSCQLLDAGGEMQRHAGEPCGVF